MQLGFSGEVWHWKGPAPWYFVTVPDQESAALESASGLVTYGWGMIPVRARIGRTGWTTSLWPRDGRYVVPIKAVIRRAERIDLGDVVDVELTVEL